MATCISAVLSNYNVSCSVYPFNVLSSASADRQLCACTTAYLSHANTIYFSFCPVGSHINLTYYFYIVRFHDKYNDMVKVCL